MSRPVHLGKIKATILFQDPSAALLEKLNFPSVQVIKPTGDYEFSLVLQVTDDAALHTYLGHDLFHIFG
jgi:hypothetical protein